MSIRLTHEEFRNFQTGARIIQIAAIFWFVMILLCFPELGALLPRQAQNSLQAIREYAVANPPPPRPGL